MTALSFWFLNPSPCFCFRLYLEIQSQQRYELSLRVGETFPIFLAAAKSSFVWLLSCCALAGMPTLWCQRTSLQDLQSRQLSSPKLSDVSLWERAMFSVDFHQWTVQTSRDCVWHPATGSGYGYDDSKLRHPQALETVTRGPEFNPIHYHLADPDTID